jgi:DNA-binding beta-propeller fold protein YncE
MKFYIRKDVATTLWDYGVVAAAAPELSLEDPYAEKLVTLESDWVIGEPGVGPVQFSSPRSIAFADDGSFYVADSQNHRIQHIDASGNLIQEWGTASDPEQPDPPPGLFNDPWGVAVAPDGSVYVADTWNHRIQHFTSDGQFIDSFGRFGKGYEGDIFWGPRSVVVDETGRVFVADTGNKRVAVFDSEGHFLSQFGGLESGLGQLNEPVGIAIDSQGLVYVADTWNQRVVVFEESGRVFLFAREWPIDGWWGESLENKPYIAISSTDVVCLTDPEGFRILCFDTGGNYIRGWGDYGYDFSTFGLPCGIAFSTEGYLLVSDASNNRLMRFQPEFE